MLAGINSQSGMRRRLVRIGIPHDPLEDLRRRQRQHRLFIRFHVPEERPVRRIVFGALFRHSGVERQRLRGESIGAVDEQPDPLIGRNSAHNEVPLAISRHTGRPGPRKFAGCRKIDPLTVPHFLVDRNDRTDRQPHRPSRPAFDVDKPSPNHHFRRQLERRFDLARVRINPPPSEAGALGSGDDVHVRVRFRRNARNTQAEPAVVAGRSFGQHHAVRIQIAAACSAFCAHSQSPPRAPSPYRLAVGASHIAVNDGRIVVL